MSALLSTRKFFSPSKHLKTLLKLTLLHGCFSRFLNCTIGTKSLNASHIVARIAGGNHQGLQTEFDHGRPHQTANVLLILEYFFPASCSENKAPPNITR